MSMEHEMRPRQEDERWAAIAQEHKGRIFKAIGSLTFRNFESFSCDGVKFVIVFYEDKGKPQAYLPDNMPGDGIVIPVSHSEDPEQMRAEIFVRTLKADLVYRGAPEEAAMAISSEVSGSMFGNVEGT